jgi:hypothetical protein
MLKKILVITMLVIGVLVIGTSTMPVQSSPLQDTVTGTVGGVTAYAEKKGIAGTSSWSSVVWSRADSSIGTIGYTWWTIRQYCTTSGTYPWGLNFDGDVNYGDDSHYAARYNAYVSCPFPQTYQLQNLGTHDFKQGAGTWNPTVEKIITLTP